MEARSQARRAGGAKAHRGASTGLQAVVEGAQEAERGGWRETMKGLVNRVNGSRQLPIEDTRKGSGRPRVLRHPASRTEFGARRVHDEHFCADRMYDTQEARIPLGFLAWALNNAKIC